MICIKNIIDEENKHKSDIVTQNDLKDAITQAINYIVKNKNNNVNEIIKNEKENLSKQQSQEKSVTLNANDINSIKLNEIENQISEIMKFLVSNKFDQNKADKNNKSSDYNNVNKNGEMISINVNFRLNYIIIVKKFLMKLIKKTTLFPNMNIIYRNIKTN